MRTIFAEYNPKRNSINVYVTPKTVTLKIKAVAP